MSNNRLRMFAGPNGSGKSTVFNEIRDNYKLDQGSTYLNADEIEKELTRKKIVSISDYNLDPQIGLKFDVFLKQHSLFKKASLEGYEFNLSFNEDSIISTNSKSHSYEASILTDFLRAELIDCNQDVSFETVMSHPSKIETLKISKERGYRNYLYFISTDSVEINKSRVLERVLSGGHPVPANKIEDRYFKSLSLLREAIKYTYRTFIFDNSESKSRLILDIFDGKEATYRCDKVPKWVDEYCLNK
jgi:predicted ABC-type ATPase